jgi:hypothetical protein
MRLSVTPCQEYARHPLGGTPRWVDAAPVAAAAVASVAAILLAVHADITDQPPPPPSPTVKRPIRMIMIRCEDVELIHRETVEAGSDDVCFVMVEIVLFS